MTDHRRIAGMALCGILISAVFAVSSTPAEVAVSLPTGALYQVQSIVDDPEPVGIVWARYNQASSTTLVLNEQGQANGDGDPSLLVTAGGVSLVAWARNSASGYDVVLSRFVNGAWSDAEMLAGSAADELDPVLVQNPSDGSVHLVYWIDGPSPYVMHRQTSDLASWTVAEQVSEAGIPACRPTAVFHGGLLHVVYEMHDSGIGTSPRQIVISTREGQTYISEMLSVTQYAGANWPRVHSKRGRLWVDWIDADDEMAWIRRAPGGGWDPVQIESFTTVEEREFHVRGEIKSKALE